MPKLAVANPRHAPSEVLPAPILARAATLLLGNIAEGAEAWEFGAGGSTLWLAQRAKSLISIEDDPQWHAVVTDGLAQAGLEADVRLVPTDVLPDAITDTGLYDLVFVDCATTNERRRATILGAKHVRPGGWLVVDDYNWAEARKAVDALAAAGWDVGIVTGTKMHPIRHKPVKALTAFCWRKQQ